MLTINGQSGEFVIDLNQSNNQIYEFAIVSEKSNGRFIPIGIDINTNLSAIQVEWKQDHKIVFIVDLEQIKQTETVYLKNYIKERLAVRFLPNIEESSPKIYTFKVGKTQVDGKKLSLSIISKQNKKSWPWEIEYLSPTLSYNAHQTQNKLVVELQTIVADKLFTVIILTQQKSNKHLILHLEHPDDNTVVLENIEEARQS